MSLSDIQKNKRLAGKAAKALSPMLSKNEAYDSTEDKLKRDKDLKDFFDKIS